MTSDPPDSWYDPPLQHEIDLCFDCHEEGYHDDDKEYWIKRGCDFCQREIDELHELPDSELDRFEEEK